MVWLRLAATKQFEKTENENRMGFVSRSPRKGNVMEAGMKNAAQSIMQIISGGVNRIIISGPLRAACRYKKVEVLPAPVKGTKSLQFSFYTQDKVFHFNAMTAFDIEKQIEELAQEGYKQWEIDCDEKSAKILMNKKGNFKIIESAPSALLKKAEGHNRQKNYAFKEGEPLDMLIQLGLMNKEGKIFADKQKKFRQINKFIEIVESVSKHIDEGAHILDFGCGKSYLTFALYYYLNIVQNKDIKITGIDLKADVVEYCNALAEKCGFNRLEFFCGDVSRFEMEQKCQMMVTLHACDTATDFALAYAAKKNVKVILSVPCCQHELFKQVDNDILSPMLKHGILKDRFSALLTDAARGQLLESVGYKVSIMEFIDMEHTPKNIMIKAVRTKSEINVKKLEDYRQMAESYNVKPTLFNLLEGEFDER